MKIKIIKIGNSKGILIPRRIIEKCRLTDEVELEAQPRQLVVRPVGGPRHGWAAAFEKMAQYGDDELVDEEIPETKWSRKDWKW